MKRFALVLALAGLASHALPALGAVTPISQGRGLQTFAVYSPAQGENDASTETIQNLELGEWNEEAICHVGEPGAEAIGTAYMTSRIDETGVSITASTRGDADIRVPEDFAEGLGTARATYVFSVDTTTPCRVVVNALEQGNGSFTFLLRVHDGPIIILAPFDVPEIAIDELVQLEPGTYEVNTQSSGFGQAFNGTDTIAAVDYSIEISFPSPTSVPSLPVAAGPTVWPNPFSESTQISLRNAIDSETIEVIDPAGRLVRQFAVQGAGEVRWDGRDDAGQRVGAGIYFVRAGQRPATRVVVLR